MAVKFTIGINEEGEVEEVGGKGYEDKYPEGPKGKVIQKVATITIVQTNPMCWIYSGGRWFLIPC